MNTKDHGKVIPFFPRPREETLELDAMRELSLTRRRGFETVELVAPRQSTSPQPSPGPASSASAAVQELSAAQLSRHFIDSLDAMVCGTPVAQTQPLRWPSGRSAPLEKVATDIIDMLFGFVIDNAHLPRGIKESLLRAQLPMLQMAMREPDFFADWQHPARHLLNDIIPLHRAFRERGGQSVAFEAAFVDAMNTTLDLLTPNGAAFARMHAALENAAFRTADDEREIREAEAWQHAEAAARQFFQRPIPQLARDFLTGYWIDVLQKNALRSGLTSPEWQDAVAVVEDLAWSLAPKVDAEERLHLIGLIPSLLTRLNRGLDMIALSNEERRPFFDTLIEIHANLLRSEMTPPPAAPDITSINAPERPIDQVMRLQRGDWVQFTLSDGSSSRERLTWISPQRGILVFSNHLGQRAIQIAPDDLAELVSTQRAMLIFDQSPESTGRNSA